MKDYSFYKGKEQTYLKHLVLENYLERLSWIIGFGSDYGKICYVDGFSGPWKSGSEDYGDTSIRISLDILAKTKSGLQERGKSVKFKCIFVEKEEEQFNELKSILMHHPRSGIEAHPLHGEFEDLIDEVLSKAEGFFTLFFIDPSGWTGYGLKKIARIVSRPNSEVLINFMFDYINRFLKPHIDQSIARSFDDLFGDTGWRGQIPEGQGREDAILSYYKECLRKIGGYQYVINTPILKPTEDRTYTYYQQLCIYAHILETRDGNRPDRLLLYWTGEPKKEHALMSFPYRPDMVEQAGAHFDEVVKCILNRQFTFGEPLEPKVCKECDLRAYCTNERVLPKPVIST